MRGGCLHSGWTCFTEVSLVTETWRCNGEQEVHLAWKEVHKGGGMEGGLTCGVAAVVERGKHKLAAATPALTLCPEEHTENSNIVSQMFHFLL